MGRTLHINGSPRPIVYKYRHRASLPKLLILTDRPLQGPVDEYALRHVPIATAMLESEHAVQRVLVALDRDFAIDQWDVSTVLVDFEQVNAIQKQMNLPLCILFDSPTENVSECVYVNA